MWIKAAEKPVDKTGQVTSQAQKKKHLSPSVYHQGLFLWYDLDSDLLMLGRPGRMTLRKTPIRL
jgi:Leu/Phe-tRNA-protein transferase